MSKAKKSAPKKIDKNPPTAIRLPPELKKRAMERAAQEQRRTLTDIIIFALEKYLE